MTGREARSEWTLTFTRGRGRAILPRPLDCRSWLSDVEPEAMVPRPSGHVPNRADRRPYATLAWRDDTRCDHCRYGLFGARVVLHDANRQRCRSPRAPLW
jgi:hypothetical protein